MKKIIPFFFFLIAGLGLYVYLSYSSLFSFSGKQEEVIVENKIDMAKLGENSKKEIREILNEYEKIENPQLGEFAALRDRLLSITVPAELKAVHLNLVLAFGRAESFVANGMEEDKEASEKIIKDLKEKNSWLN